MRALPHLLSVGPCGEGVAPGHGGGVVEGGQERGGVAEPLGGDAVVQDLERAQERGGFGAGGDAGVLAQGGDEVGEPFFLLASRKIAGGQRGQVVEIDGGDARRAGNDG